MMSAARQMLGLLVLASLLISACMPLVEPMEEPAGEVSAPEVTEYAHPEVLATTDWLAEHLDDPSLRVVDARKPPIHDVYAAGHIPGAVPVDVMGELSDPDSQLPLMIMPAVAFENLMGRLGISNDSTVVIYDAHGGTWAARLWWALRYYGHEDVKLLNGGLYQWIAEGRPLERQAATVEPAEFHARVNEALIASAADVLGAIDQPTVQIVDALPKPYYIGAVQMSPAHRSGHVPGAISLPAPDFLDVVDETVLPPDQVAAMLAAAEVQPDLPTITYCGAGYYGAFDLFILYLMGHEDLSLYDGSWLEWGMNPELPVEVSAS